VFFLYATVMDLFTERVTALLNKKKAEAAARLGTAGGGQVDGTVESLAEVDGIPFNISKVIRDIRTETQRRSRVLKRKPLDTAGVAGSGGIGGSGGSGGVK
jgi:hypothetical protein